MKDIKRYNKIQLTHSCSSSDHDLGLIGDKPQKTKVPLKKSVAEMSYLSTT